MTEPTTTLAPPPALTKEERAMLIKIQFAALQVPPWTEDDLISLGKIIFAKTDIKSLAEKDPSLFNRLLPHFAKIVDFLWDKILDAENTQPAPMRAQPTPTLAPPPALTKEERAMLIKIQFAALQVPPWTKDDLISLGKIIDAKTDIKSLAEKDPSLFNRLLPHFAKIVDFLWDKILDAQNTQPAPMRAQPTPTSTLPAPAKTPPAAASTPPAATSTPPAPANAPPAAVNVPPTPVNVAAAPVNAPPIPVNAPPVPVNTPPVPVNTSPAPITAPPAPPPLTLVPPASTDSVSKS